MAAGEEFGREGEDVRPVRKLAWVAGLLTGVVLVGGLWFLARPVSVFWGIAELRLVLSGAHSHRIAVEQIRVHYYVLGPETGTPVVLVHGLGSRAEDWDKLAPSLAMAGYRVYLPDLPGYGQSERPADFSYSISDEAAVMAAFMEALGLKQVDLGGWSMGGWIAQEIAAKHPERVKKLMLFDSAGFYWKPEWNTALFTPDECRRNCGTGRAADAESAQGSLLCRTRHFAHLEAERVGHPPRAGLDAERARCD